MFLVTRSHVWRSSCKGTRLFGDRTSFESSYFQLGYDAEEEIASDGFFKKIIFAGFPKPWQDRTTSENGT